MAQSNNQLESLLNRDLTEIKDMKSWLGYYTQLVDIFATTTDELVRVTQSSGSVQYKQKLHCEILRIHYRLVEFARVSKTMVF